MTTVLRKKNSRTRIIITTEERTRYYKGEPIKKIDYSDTTAQCNFCEIILENGEKGLVQAQEIDT